MQFFSFLFFFSLWYKKTQKRRKSVIRCDSWTELLAASNQKERKDKREILSIMFVRSFFFLFRFSFIFSFHFISCAFFIFGSYFSSQVITLIYFTFFSFYFFPSDSFLLLSSISNLSVSISLYLSVSLHFHVLLMLPFAPKANYGKPWMNVNDIQKRKITVHTHGILYVQMMRKHTTQYNTQTTATAATNKKKDEKDKIRRWKLIT